MASEIEKKTIGTISCVGYQLLATAVLFIECIYNTHTRTHIHYTFGNPRFQHTISMNETEMLFDFGDFLFESFKYFNVVNKFLLVL